MVMRSFPPFSEVGFPRVARIRQGVQVNEY